jgi:hypothetical protein
MIPSYKYMQGCFVAFILISLICLPLEGAFLGSSENTLLTEMTQWTTRGTGWFALPMFGIGLLVHLPQLISGDYPIFTSLGIFGIIVRLIIWGPIAYGLVWGFFTVLYPIIASAMANLARGLLSWIR